ncbi:hypothetical protein VP01_863g2 [Puccinia sorghi]|uniref:Uncharacterized protein n=1 Tax=Puccinia sorghi TaxID=27349 RepID=A0A0L6U8T6_9BASI|nr:hypothetical protein VP01_863g2 [Puccinia sorghi]
MLPEQKRCLDIAGPVMAATPGVRRQIQRQFHKHISMQHTQQQQDDSDAIAIIAALVILGKTMPIRSLQTYRTRANLPEIGNNWAFITVMGIDVWTFGAILVLVPFSSVWESSTISQLDVNQCGKKN